MLRLLPSYQNSSLKGSGTIRDVGDSVSQPGEPTASISCVPLSRQAVGSSEPVQDETSDLSMGFLDTFAVASSPHMLLLESTDVLKKNYLQFLKDFRSVAILHVFALSSPSSPSCGRLPLSGHLLTKATQTPSAEVGVLLHDF